MTEPRWTAGDEPDERWRALARSLSGEDSPGERDALRRELDAHPERAALVDALAGALERLPAAVTPEVDVEAALSRTRFRRHRPVRAARPLRLLPLAAAIVLAVGLALLRARPPASEPLRYATAAGEWSSITLPDQSRVRLGPSSRLEVPTRFRTGERALELYGEAYFEVQHDAARPFTVTTPRATVRDLGTVFSVRADQAEARVAVREGAVSLAARAGRDQAVLRAGDRGAVDAAGHVIVERGQAGPEDLDWAQGRLVFRAAPMGRVASEMGRWYGVVVVVRDSALVRRRVTATFQDESADEALRVVGAALGADIRRHGDTAYVVPRRAP